MVAHFTDHDSGQLRAKHSCQSSEVNLRDRPHTEPPLYSATEAAITKYDMSLAAAASSTPRSWPGCRRHMLDPPWPRKCGEKSTSDDSRGLCTGISGRNCSRSTGRGPAYFQTHRLGFSSGASMGLITRTSSKQPKAVTSMNERNSTAVDSEHSELARSYVRRASSSLLDVATLDRSASNGCVGGRKDAASGRIDSHSRCGHDPGSFIVGSISPGLVKLVEERGAPRRSARRTPIDTACDHTFLPSDLVTVRYRRDGCIKRRRRAVSSFRCRSIQMTVFMLLLATGSVMISVDGQTNTTSPTVAPAATPAPIPVPPTTSTPTKSPSTSSPTKQNTKAPATESPTAVAPSTKSPTGIPTSRPTISVAPSIAPTSFPSNVPSTPEPTGGPSQNPSGKPSMSPSGSPTVAPTFVETSTLSDSYRQSFQGTGLERMNTTQVVLFEEIFANYTFDYADPTAERVTTMCVVTGQTVLSNGRALGVRGLSSLLSWSNSIRSAAGKSLFGSFNRRELQGADGTGTVAILSVDYTMTWSSNLTNVLGDNETISYGERFKLWMTLNTSQAQVQSDLQEIGMPVEEVGIVFSIKQEPTQAPTSAPSPPLTEPPSLAPSAPQTASPTGSPPLDFQRYIIIGGAAGGFLVIFLSTSLFILARRRKAKRNAAVGDTPVPKELERPPSVDEVDLEDKSHSRSDHSYGSSPDGSAKVIPDDSLQQQESLVSQPSMVSANLSMDIDTDSDLEEDRTHQIADEFDSYKNKDLEKMRAEVEGTVTNTEGMFSQALTRALIDDHDTNRDVNGLMWGGDGDSMEIEASVLCETSDWLKRKDEGASVEERRSFMQELLNKMVASVRFNIIAPEKASRAIHGAAAMLQLQLAGDLPETSLVVTGMRKKVERKDVIEAFKEFGEIEGAAVSPNERGFGLVRYRSPKSVQRAMERFRTDEIVVQDVSVNVRVLSKFVPRPELAIAPTEVVELSRHYSDEGRRQSAYGVERRERPRGVLQGGLEANHLPQLETIGYPEDSLGRASDLGRKPTYPVRSRPGSENGSGGGSASARSSSKSHNSHSRHRSNGHASNDMYSNVRKRP